MNLDALDASGPFTVLADGELYELTDPADMPWQVVGAAITDVGIFVEAAFGEDLPHVPQWKLDATQSAWIQHHDLPDAAGVRRLHYLLSRFRDAIEIDLADRNEDLGELWRSRRWRYLLSRIDHLPQASHFVDAMANDDEIAETIASRPAGEQRGPRIADWTPELAALNDVVDMLGSVIQAVIAAAGVKPPTIARASRPRTAVDRARARQRIERHRSLAARLLPKKT